MRIRSILDNVYNYRVDSYNLDFFKVRNELNNWASKSLKGSYAICEDSAVFTLEEDAILFMMVWED